MQAQDQAMQCHASLHHTQESGQRRSQPDSRNRPGVEGCLEEMTGRGQGEDREIEQRDAQVIPPPNLTMMRVVLVLSSHISLDRETRRLKAWAKCGGKSPVWFILILFYPHVNKIGTGC